MSYRIEPSKFSGTASGFAVVDTTNGVTVAYRSTKSGAEFVVDELKKGHFVPMVM